MNIKFKKRYQKILDQFHQISPQIHTKYKYFLAGFIEGKGSYSISIKNRTKSIRIDPEFNISQHINGIVHLIACMNLFKTGNICLETGKRNIFVFKITNRRALKEKFVPYYKKYILPYTCEQKKNNFQLFSLVLNLLEQKVHLNPEELALKILPIVYKMDVHKSKAQKWSLESLQTKILKTSEYTGSLTPFLALRSNAKNNPTTNSSLGTNQAIVDQCSRSEQAITGQPGVKVNFFESSETLRHPIFLF